MSNDAGSTCALISAPRPTRTMIDFLSFLGSAIPGQNTQFFPHKGVLSPAEKTLYISYSDGAGPYDGKPVVALF